MADSSNKWMVALWEDHYLLLLVTFVGENGVTPSKLIFYRRFKMILTADGN